MSIANDEDNWEILREVPEGEFPSPATGRLVVALEPPTRDGMAELEGELIDLPSEEYLALAWENRHGKQVLNQTDGFLLMFGREDATWLPDGWTADVFPAGWTPAHLRRWFDYALE